MFAVKRIPANPAIVKHLSLVSYRSTTTDKPSGTESQRLQEFRKKLREKAPIGELNFCDLKATRSCESKIKINSSKCNLLKICNYSLCYSDKKIEKTNQSLEAAAEAIFVRKFHSHSIVGAVDKLEEFEEGKHPYQEKEPLEAFPDNTNPKTGEIGGPRGPEPTRYGDWERKGRVSDF